MSADWTDRIWREFRAGNLTRTYRDVLLTLRTFRGTGGVCVPSHETLAERVACSVRTVRRALNQAQRLELVIWSERRIRAGWRWLRTSNAYRLILPESAVRPGLRPAFPQRATNGHFGQIEERKEKQGAQESRKAALTAMLREAADMPDLLAMRRAAMEARLSGRAGT